MSPTAGSQDPTTPTNSVNSSITCPQIDVYFISGESSSKDGITVTRDVNGDTATTCGYTAQLQHFSNYYSSSRISSSSGSSGSSSSSSSSSSGGGYGTSCDSKGFGIGRSLQVYEISYDIESELVSVKAYSTCGAISVKVSTPNGQRILGLSSDQPYLDEQMVVYSGQISKESKKFTVLLENNRHYFDETFYIKDSSILRKYFLETAYTSEQEGSIHEQKKLTDIISMAIPEPTMDPEPTENNISTVESTLESVKIQSTEIIKPEGYITEHISEKLHCGIGTFAENGICKVIKTNEPEFCFLFWCW